MGQFYKTGEHINFYDISFRGNIDGEGMWQADVLSREAILKKKLWESIKQSINLLKSQRGIEVALSITGSCIRRMKETEIKEKKRKVDT